MQDWQGKDIMAELERVMSMDRFLAHSELARAAGQGGIAFGPEDLRLRLRLASLMQDELGLDVRVDAWANVIGRRPGRLSGPAIAAGTHADGGKPSGSGHSFLALLEAFRALAELDIITDHPLELVLFSAGGLNPYGPPGLGSAGMAGSLKPQDFSEREVIALIKGLRRLGGNPSCLDEAVLQSGRWAAFVELRLGEAGVGQAGREEPGLAIPEGVTSVSRLRLNVGSRSAGDLDQGRDKSDLLAAAAEFILSIERLAQSEQGKAEARVNSITVSPGEAGAPPDLIRLDAEVSGMQPAALDRIMDGIEESARGVSCSRNVSFTGEATSGAGPTVFSPMVRRCAQQASDRLGLNWSNGAVGSGYAAEKLAMTVPCALILAPSPPPLLHSAGLMALTLLALDAEAQSQPR